MPSVELPPAAKSIEGTRTACCKTYSFSRRQVGTDTRYGTGVKIDVSSGSPDQRANMGGKPRGNPRRMHFCRDRTDGRIRQCWTHMDSHSLLRDECTMPSQSSTAVPQLHHRCASDASGRPGFTSTSDGISTSGLNTFVFKSRGPRIGIRHSSDQSSRVLPRNIMHCRDDCGRLRTLRDDCGRTETCLRFACAADMTTETSNTSRSTGA